MHCALWLITLFADHLVKAKHHDLRICGYLDFYQSTYQHIRTPLFIVSLWNTTYLFLAVLLHHTHKHNYEEYCHSSRWFSPLNYIMLLTTLELSIIFPVYVTYISKFFYLCVVVHILQWALFIERVLKINRTKPPPDVMREEWLANFTQNSYSGEVGYYQRGTILSDLLEKQADLIRYLRDHNVKLSHRIMLLASNRRLT